LLAQVAEKEFLVRFVIESATPGVGALRSRHRRHYELVRRDNGKIVDPKAIGLMDSCGRGRRRRFEPDGNEYDLLVGRVSRRLQRGPNRADEERSAGPCDGTI
jgi:hypothetical protein